MDILTILVIAIFHGSVKYEYKYVGVMLLVVTAMAGLIFLPNGDSASVVSLGQTEEIIISAPIPATTGLLPCYTVLYEEREEESSPNIMDTKNSIPSEKESSGNCQAVYSKTRRTS